MFAGCATSNVGKAYQATAFTITTVNAAEDVYGELYRAGKISVTDQGKVHKAVDAYNAAMDIEKQAVIAYYGSKDDVSKQNALSIAEATVAASRADLVTLIAAFLPTDQANKLLATK